MALETELARADRGEVTPARRAIQGAGGSARSAAARSCRCRPSLSCRWARWRSALPDPCHRRQPGLTPERRRHRASRPPSGGWIDLGFVVVVVLPLILLAVTYDVVSAERERAR
jgi:hypothetical protein